MNSSEKLWGGRFKTNTHATVERFNASIHFDQRLASVDILGSLAHVHMLGHCGIISAGETVAIIKGLQHLYQQQCCGSLQLSLADEDIHMNIERLLQQEIGPLAGKLHTGRSRNDQVALDMHLYLREELLQIIGKIITLQNSLINQAEQHIDTLVPGYTHLQRAQPVRLAHHLLAYAWMLSRDTERLIDLWPRINRSPLGSGALAGSGFAIDPHYTAHLLRFDDIYYNSMDAVSDRDFVVEFLAANALLMSHLSRLSEELVLWSSQEFSFIELDDTFCTGSSMLPHKKNPDVPELVRGKSGRVVGALVAMLTVLKALPLSYNKDLQEDKEIPFDSIDTIKHCLDIYTPMLASMRVNTARMQAAVENDFSAAMQIANYLTRKNIPFRESHTIAGRIVLFCMQQKITLHALPLSDYQSFCAEFSEDIYQHIHPLASVEACQAPGGTGQNALQQQLQQFKHVQQQQLQWLQQKQQLLDELNHLTDKDQ